MIVHADFHIHAAGDPYDHIHHSVRDVIDHAQGVGLHCIAITNHVARTWNEEDAAYAREKGILLLPGAEIRVHNCDVLVINADEDVLAIRTMDDLRAYRDPARLIIAPHPFYPIPYALGNLLPQHHYIFDAVEVSGCYHKWHNRYNMLARACAKTYGLATLGNSDTHHLWQCGECYTKIECDALTAEDVFAAIRRGAVTPQCTPMSLSRIFRFVCVGALYRRVRRAVCGKSVNGER